MENRNNNRNRSILVKSLSSYVNKRQPGQFGKNGYFKPQDQGCYGLCWAYSIAAAFQIAMERVKYREGGYPTFDQILEELFKEAEIIDIQSSLYWQDDFNGHPVWPYQKNFEMSLYNSKMDYLKNLNTRIFKEGRVNEQVLKQNCRKFRLRFKEADFCEAKEALNAERVLVARFYLKGFQWHNFCEFFSINPKGVLTRDYINKINNTKEEAGGHSVVLVSNENGNLSFINSWGEDWGDGGFFTIQNENVLDHLQFFDVYWLLSDLTNKEKKAFGYVVDDDDEQNLGCQVI